MASDSIPIGFQQKGRGTRPKSKQMLIEAKVLQELIAEDTKGEGLKPIERAALARVWKELGEFRLRLQGKGPPKAVDYASKKPKTKASHGFTETPVENGKVKAKTVTETDTQKP